MELPMKMHKPLLNDQTVDLPKISDLADSKIHRGTFVNVALLYRGMFLSKKPLHLRKEYEPISRPCALSYLSPLLYDVHVLILL